MLGIDSIRLLLSIKAPLLIGLGLLLLGWAWHYAGGFGPILSQPSAFAPGGPKSGQFFSVFVPSLTGMVGFWATLSLNIPDFTRYAVSQKAQIKGQALALPPAMTLFAFIGVVVTSATTIIYGTTIWDPVALAGRFDVSRRLGSAGGGEIDYAREEIRDSGGRLALRIFASLKLVIGAVNGAAVGVGATMLLPMDIRLASTAARFGFPFVRRGLVPEACSTWFLPRAVGMQRAMEWVATGRVFPADEALAAGLVRSLHAPDELLPAARSLAAEVARDSAPVSVALSRQLMWRCSGPTTRCRPTATRAVFCSIEVSAAT